ncbi:unnamed protein product [Eruca vesicaria subsp. sativa]|uniref:Aconitate hydratase n=1 Tax=Eruca vesicaria subsp. sativa TaxID=29727 RepID=A0ABC8LEB8_ERUVS|nr:unnamed protein product [Eruca vesicaria subsp. sativa]
MRWSHGTSWRSPASLRAQTRIAALVLQKFKRKFATIASQHAYKDIITTLHKPDGGNYGKFYSLPALNDPRIDRLPFSVRILLESAIRNCDNFHITKDNIGNIMDWENTSRKKVEIPFKPARVMLRDFTGLPVIVDLAAMRDAMKSLGHDPNKINPQVPVDLVFDHSDQVYGEKPETWRKGMQLESDKNWERFMFLKWASSAFYNMLIASPVSSTVHQVDLEYLCSVVCNSDGYLYPDSVVGAYSNTALGVAGWEVGGLEAEAAILGQPISVVLPNVVGFKLVGKMRVGVSLTDLVRTVTQMLRNHGVFGNFVEFYGEKAMSELSVDGRAKIAMLSPEYEAIMGFFPVDHVALEYLKLKGRSDETVAAIESYLRANKMFIDYNEPQEEIAYTSCLQLNLGDVEPCVYGPKRIHDRVLLKDMKADWKACLDNPPGFKGFAIPKEEQEKNAKFSFMGQPAEVKHGSVVIATITSGNTKTSPSDMVEVALVAKKAYNIGLKVKPWVRTSFSPGYGFFKEYLLQSGLQEYLDKQGFQFLRQGFTTSIWGTGDLDESTASAISENDIVAAAVLSSSRDFGRRIHTYAKANYLASPPLVVAYALAGTVNIDFETEPIGTGKDGKNVYLSDIWPSSEEVNEALQNSVLQSLSKSTYETITKRNYVATSCTPYSWDSNSTYINEPPYFKNMGLNPPGPREVKDAYCLLKFGDNITTDHISPAGTIHKDSPAAEFLKDKVSDFNSYGSRRGNHEVMTRGTFSNTSIVNELLNGEIGPKTVHIPTGEKLCVFDAATRYKTAGQDTIILAGAEYGSGYCRDWAVKGPKLLGVKAIIAKSFDRVHRSNLASIGIVPLCFKPGEDAETLGLTGHERYTIHLPSKVNEIKPSQDITVTTDTGKSFTCTLRLDSKVSNVRLVYGND